LSPRPFPAEGEIGTAGDEHFVVITPEEFGRSAFGVN
jgi:hypothetical protein